MKQIRIKGTDLDVSKLVFGTDRIHHTFSAIDRQNLLERVIDQGFTHFDTAPLYGYGVAERELGKLKASGKDFTISTKICLYSPGGDDQSLRTTIFRKTFGKVFGKFNKPVVDFSIKAAETSVNNSLRRLSSECIDILLIHEPIADLINTDEWMKLAQNLKASGKIKYLGLAGNIENIRECMQLPNDLFQIIQTQNSLRHLEAKQLEQFNREAQFTYGYISSEMRVSSNVNSNAILREAAYLNPRGAIILTTTSADRIKNIAI